MPIFPATANHENAVACVCLVDSSEIIVRIVTMLPANTPAAHRKRIICGILFARPNAAVAITTPNKEDTNTGLRPIWSDKYPQRIMTSIWVRLKRDSIKPE
ncbi:hypothetical protein RRF57_009253 [Xylaria bambusicola]|uniref:Uncharacterized protein n=1 Tax=Xylaria bambusicola TaxID=326684 RepID=A0AAN7UZ72_9PEZI